WLRHAKTQNEHNESATVGRAEFVRGCGTNTSGLTEVRHFSVNPTARIPQALRSVSGTPSLSRNRQVLSPVDSLKHSLWSVVIKRVAFGELDFYSGIAVPIG